MTTDGLKADHVDTQADILAGMTKADFDARAKEHLNLDDMIIIVIGDTEKVYDDVAELGFKMVDIDADGNPT